MSASEVNKIITNVTKIYDRRKAALYALAVSYAGQAINLFRREQNEQTFWTNQTNQANSRMFAKAFKIDKKLVQEEIGFFLSHAVEYGVYLELSNNRQNEAIRPIMIYLAPRFIADAKKVIAGIS